MSIAKNITTEEQVDTLVDHMIHDYSEERHGDWESYLHHFSKKFRFVSLLIFTL